METDERGLKSQNETDRGPPTRQTQKSRLSGAVLQVRRIERRVEREMHGQKERKKHRGGKRAKGGEKGERERGRKQTG